MTVALLLDMICAAAPDRIAVSDGEHRWTYRELDRRTRGAGETMTSNGTAKVAYLGSNSAVFALTAFGAARAGIPIVPLNYRLERGRIAQLIERLGKNVLVVASDTHVDWLSSLGANVVESQSWLHASDVGSPGSGLPEHSPDAVAALLFTSGTTAEPKAAILRSNNLLAYVLGTVELASASPTSCSVVSVPPYHIAGVANLLTNTYAGRRIRYLADFSASAWIRTIRDERATNAMVVPTMLARIVRELDETGGKLESLESLSYGGSSVPRHVIEETMRLLPHVQLVNAYGLTETSSTIAMLGPEDHRAAVTSPNAKVQRRLSSVGRLLPGVEAEIRDANGHALPVNVTGELWVRGAQVSGEYVGLRETRADGGWFRTRDLAELDDGGYLYLRGRADDVIIRGGENTSPAEIEEVLLEHPDIADVAVVGVPDAEWGERIVAAVVIHAGRELDLEEVRRFARNRLRSANTPDAFVVRSELPYSDTGKLLRRLVARDLSPSINS
jgi:long-chain acyl-CoA synthetase